MKKINLSYESGNIFTAYVVRYFRFKTNTYLIYTLQEKDNRDYMKLYVVKIMDELNEKVSQTVRRNDEWKLMKGIVKTILTEIKNHRLTSIEDLEISELENLTIYESKNFFIASDLVEMLSTEQEQLNNDNESPRMMNDNFNKNELNNIDEEIEVLELDDDINECLLSPTTVSETELSGEIEVLEL